MHNRLSVQTPLPVIANKVY